MPGVGPPTGPGNVAAVPIGRDFFSACPRPALRVERGVGTHALRRDGTRALGPAPRVQHSLRGQRQPLKGAGSGRRAGRGAGRGEPGRGRPGPHAARTPAAGGWGTGGPSPAPAMAARQSQGPVEPLPAGRGTLGAGSSRARPKLRGVFRCVEDAFENKTLQLDASGGGRRSLRAGKPYSGPRGDPEGPGEPGRDGLEAAARLEEPPRVTQGRGSQQVVAAGQRPPGRGAGAGPLPKSPGSPRGREGLALPDWPRLCPGLSCPAWPLSPSPCFRPLLPWF